MNRDSLGRLGRLDRLDHLDRHGRQLTGAAKCNLAV